MGMNPPRGSKPPDSGFLAPVAEGVWESRARRFRILVATATARPALSQSPTPPLFGVELLDLALEVLLFACDGWIGIHRIRLGHRPECSHKPPRISSRICSGFQLTERSVPRQTFPTSAGRHPCPTRRGRGRMPEPAPMWARPEFLLQSKTRLICNGFGGKGKSVGWSAATRHREPLQRFRPDEENRGSGSITPRNASHPT